MIELTPVQLTQLEHLFENFNEYAKEKSLRDMIAEESILVAATITVSRAAKSHDITDVLHAFAFGVYLAEICKARFMEPAGLNH